MPSIIAPWPSLTLTRSYKWYFYKWKKLEWITTFTQRHPDKKKTTYCRNKRRKCYDTGTDSKQRVSGYIMKK